MKFTVREKFASIRNAVVEADSVEEAFEIARRDSDTLFPFTSSGALPEGTETYLETSYDAWDEADTLFQSTLNGLVVIHRQDWSVLARQRTERRKQLHAALSQASDTIN